VARPIGSRNRLVTLDYDVIAELAGGITGDTARRYAQRGQFDPRSLDSVLSWVNSRRKRQGEPLIGLPTDDAPQAHSDVTAADAPIQASLPPEDTIGHSPLCGITYDPMTGEFRGCDDGRTR